MSELYQQLRSSVAGGHVALRSHLVLDPAGGPASKVMPPTYGDTGDPKTKYSIEERVDEQGETTQVVLLDSVGSQANRLEEALKEGWEFGELNFAVALVDFSSEDGLADLGELTTLDAPHRLADAIFRDSLLDSTLFRLSDVGQAVTNANPKSAAALMAYCPHALVFGMWDSTGPKGGLGSKFQRSLVSEIVGFDAVAGKTVGSRMDPLDIRASVTGIVKSKDDEVWGFTDKGKLRPSEINHGNIVPSVDSQAGGVTISRAEQSAVLSFASLRRLRFPTQADGTPIEATDRRDAEVAARTALAALAIASLVYQIEMDFDLRSRCLLIPRSTPTFELLRRDGKEADQFDINREQAAALLDEAAKEAGKYGVGFGDNRIVMQPAPKLVTLIKRSRDEAKKEDPTDDDSDK